MTVRNTILLTTITCGAGAFTGMITAKKNNTMGFLIGASLGAAAGYSAAMLCKKLQDKNIGYYTEVSPFYKDDESFDYI